MNKIRRNQIILAVVVLAAVGCMAHISIKYNNAVERLEQLTASNEAMKNAYIRYLERKANITSPDSITDLESETLSE